MRNYLLFLIIGCGLLLAAQTEKYSGDGPYLFYKDSLIVVQVADSTHKHSSSDTLLLKNKKELKLMCTFSDPKFNFSFPLKTMIKNEVSEYSKVGKIFVVSDIEGEFYAFRDLLLAGGVIDSLYNWRFGNGHLVVCGDMFDRGEQVSEALWLLYALEDKAESMGGKVHFILGNHDVMNISADLRYVHPKYFKSAALLNKSYNQLYDDNSELGRWIRSKNIIETIDSLLFVHAGISAELTTQPLSLSQINDSTRSLLSAKGKVDKKKGLAASLLGTNSPIWYRGYYKDPECSELLKNTAKKFDTAMVLTGHTVVDKIELLHSGKVIGVDTQHAEGNSQGLLIENNVFTVIDKSGSHRQLR